MSDSKGQAEPTMEEILASIRRIISEDGQPAAEPDPRADAVEPEDDDVLELTEVVEDETASHGSTAAPPSQADIDAIMNGSADSEVRMPESRPDVSWDQAAAEPTPEPVAEPPQPPADETLVSPGAAAASTAAFAGLAGALGGPRPLSGDIPLGAGGRTLEDIVREMLRPMLKEWLDANLPQTVDRLVKREIERLARGAEDR